MKNILSIDVEELFHTEYARDLTKNRPFFRTPYTINTILNFLDEYDVKATFFIVGEVAKKFPGILREINERGHEVAFHSYDHKPLTEKNPYMLRREIDDFNKILTSVTDNICVGFRAPSFSLNNRTIWALEVLEEMGILYDSSVFPTLTPLYGVPSAPTTPYKPSKRDLSIENLNCKLWEFPLTVYSILGLRFPAAGGFYLRFAPSLVRRAIKKTNKLGFPAVIYFHSWELDDELPRFKLNPYRSFITYHNCEKMLNLFMYLLREFKFTSFQNYMKESGIFNN